MKSLMQEALGADWAGLPEVLKAHYRGGNTRETGQLSIEYPALMGPVLLLMRCFGALINRRTDGVSTVVEKSMKPGYWNWRRTLTFPDGQSIRFNSVWVLATKGQLIEFVNPFLGLQLEPYVEGDALCYRGVQFVLKVSRLTLGIPEWMVLGHTTIVEHAVDEHRYAMDFRLTHPWFGQVYRYSGQFEVEPDAERLRRNSPADLPQTLSVTACPIQKCSY